MVTSAKSSVSRVTDQAAAMQLGQSAKNLATCLAELRTSAQKVEHRNTQAWPGALRTLLRFMYKQCKKADLMHLQKQNF